MSVGEYALVEAGGAAHEQSAHLRRLRLTLAVQGWSGAGGPMYAAAHGAFLALLHAGDPAVAQRIHDEQGRRPFSLGPLRVTPSSSGLAEAELICGVWDDALAETFMLGASRALEEPLEIGGRHATVLNCETLEQTTFAGLLGSESGKVAREPQAPTSHAQASDQLWLRFTTPTFFSFGRGLNGRHQYGVLPTPEQVVGSWLRAWGAATPAPSPLVDDAEWLRERVRVQAMRDLRTVTASSGKTLLTGFVGEVALAWCGGSPGGSRALRALARFARFCGTGAKTGMGFGQTTLRETAHG